MSLKIVFAGTSSFGLPCLQALIHSSHEIVGIYTQPDRPAGRGKKLKQSAIKELALKHSLAVFQPEIFKDKNTQIQLKHLQADLMIVVAYGLLLPKEILEVPSFGCINVHASLLPRWRGASPIQQAILADDKKSGVTIMQMNEDLDTGDILLQKSLAISSKDNARTLHDKLALLGSKALTETLEKLELHALKPIKQDNVKATYAKKIKKEEAKINWQKPAFEIERQVRAFNPWPVAYTQLNGEAIRIWQAKALSERTNQSPGKIIVVSKEGISVATSDGVLRLLEIQRPGKNKMKAVDFANGLKNKEKLKLLS